MRTANVAWTTLQHNQRRLTTHSFVLYYEKARTLLSAVILCEFFGNHRHVCKRTTLRWHWVQRELLEITPGIWQCPKESFLHRRNSTWSMPAAGSRRRWTCEHHVMFLFCRTEAQKRTARLYSLRWENTQCSTSHISYRDAIIKASRTKRNTNTHANIVYTSDEQLEHALGARHQWPWLLFKQPLCFWFFFRPCFGTGAICRSGFGCHSIFETRSYHIA